jgi:hypothetical protein
VHLLKTPYCHPFKTEDILHGRFVRLSHITCDDSKTEAWHSVTYIAPLLLRFQSTHYLAHSFSLFYILCAIAIVSCEIIYLVEAAHNTHRHHLVSLSISFRASRVLQDFFRAPTESHILSNTIIDCMDDKDECPRPCFFNSSELSVKLYFF